MGDFEVRFPLARRVAAAGVAIGSVVFGCAITGALSWGIARGVAGESRFTAIHIMLFAVLLPILSYGTIACIMSLALQPLFLCSGLELRGEHITFSRARGGPLLHARRLGASTSPVHPGMAYLRVQKATGRSETVNLQLLLIPPHLRPALLAHLRETPNVGAAARVAGAE